MSKSMVGFDIGESKLKMAYSVSGSIKKLAVVDMPDNLMRAGEILSMDAMSEFIRNAARESGIPKGACSVILPSTQVYIKSVTMPVMSENQLMFNLPYEFRDYVTEEKGKYFYDYALEEMRKNRNGEPEEMSLFACATLKSIIDGYKNMFRRAGFRLKVAIPEVSAYIELVRQHEAAQEKKEGAPREKYCIIDLGHTEVRMTILNGDRFDTRRAMDVGVVDIDRAIAESEGVDIHMARSYKISNYDGILAKAPCRDCYGRIAVEIMKSINFYNFNNRDDMLTRVYICGGGAAIIPLVEAIATTVQIDVRRITDIMESQEADFPAQYAKAIGCALQERGR